MAQNANVSNAEIWKPAPDAPHTAVEDIHWGEYDQVAAETNLRRARRTAWLTALSAVLALACFISTLLGVTQSYVGQWWAAPPAYPGATLTSRSYGETCPAAFVQTLAAYCVESFYETGSTSEWVVTYYEDLRELRFPSGLVFKTENAYPFGEQRSARTCRTILGYRSCAQVTVQGQGAALYILEIGGGQKSPASFAE
jgi:hypothetical protein